MDSESSNPRKRTRVDEDSRQITRDGEVWFDDGNIVLICENAQEDCRVAFRVHKGIISLHCDVFRDMFACYTPPENEEMYEGCPAVVMHDSHIDMRRFLKAMVLRNYAKDMKTLSLSELASLLRMATKYMFSSLREEVTTHLKLLYPSDLEYFRSNERKALLPKDFNGIVGVNLGLECDVPAILPAAFYLCWRMGPYGLLLGAHDFGSGNRVTLSTAVAPLVARFCEAFTETRTMAGFAIPPPECTCSRVHCRAVLPNIWSRQDIFLQSTLFCTFADEQSVAYAGPGICFDCIPKVYDRRRAIQQRIWRSLPGCVPKSHREASEES